MTDLGFLKLTDKDCRHSYWDFYRSFLRYRPIRSVLEIGVLNGGSLLMWKHICPHAKVVGVDRDDLLAIDLGVGIEFRQVEDAYTAAAWPDGETWDLVVDDGSHELEHQKWVLEFFRHRLNPGGCIIIEDVRVPMIRLAINGVNFSRQNVAAELFAAFQGDERFLYIVDRRPTGVGHDDLLMIYDPL